MRERRGCRAGPRRCVRVLLACVWSAAAVLCAFHGRPADAQRPPPAAAHLLSPDELAAESAESSAPGSGLPNFVGGQGPRSAPVASDTDLPSNRFAGSEVLRPEDVANATDAASVRSSEGCRLHMEILWRTQVDSGVYATPVVAQLLPGERTKQIVLGAFRDELDVLEGDGHRVDTGWPFSAPHEFFHASPLLMRRPGTPFLDVVWVSVNGEVYVVSGDLSSGGLLASLPVRLPRLRVQKYWYRGLRLQSDGQPGHTVPGQDSGGGPGAAAPTPAPTPTPEPQQGPASRRLLQVDSNEAHGEEDVDDELMAELERQLANPAEDPQDWQGVDLDDVQALKDMLRQTRARRDNAHDDDDEGEEEDDDEDDNGEDGGGGGGGGGSGGGDLDDIDETDDAFRLNPTDTEGSGLGGWTDGSRRHRRNNNGSESGSDDGDDNDDDNLAWMDQLGDGLTEEGKDSFRVFTGPEDFGPAGGNVDALDENGHLLKQRWFSKRYADGQLPEVHADGSLPPDSTSPDPSSWSAGPARPSRPGGLAPDADHVDVDPHVMATPVLADLDGDGLEDLLTTVSYFFDEDEYSARPDLLAQLGRGVDIRKYVAGGVVAYSFARRKVLWSAHLDMSTDETELRAFIYGSPTVVDLDGDGGLEVAVGTSLGFVYVLDASDGHALEGFPVAMSEVQAPVTAADVNNDGELELVASDKRGNVLCLDRHGRTVWESRVAGFATGGATFGDVNGDGVLDVVLGTTAGQLWALRGDNGRVLPGFPVKTGGKILAPALLVNLDSEQVLRPGLHVVAPSFDGHVYAVDGRTGCASRVDLGERSYAMVLADDLLDNGRVQLLVSSMTGAVVLLGTDSPFHPLKAWPSQGQGLNGFASREGYLGIFVLPESRDVGSVMGSSFAVHFAIVDARANPRGNRLYHVTFWVEGRAVSSAVYGEPGYYSADLPSPTYPVHGTVRLTMTNEHRQQFADSYSVGFNVRYYRLLKWIVAVPFLLLAAVLLHARPPPASESLG